MEDETQRGADRLGSLPSAGDRAVELHNVSEQPISPKGEKIVSANSSSDGAVLGSSRNAKEQPATSETIGAHTTTYLPYSYAPHEPSYFYVGGSGNWDEHSHYASSNNLHVISQAMYNDSSSLFFPPGYGFDAQIAYGQFSPFASPLSPMPFDGQLFSPYQMPMPLSYYPPISPGQPHVTSTLPASQSELLPSRSSSHDNLIDSAFFGSGSSYFVPFGSYGGGDPFGSSGLGLYKFPGNFGSSDSLTSHSSSLVTSKYMSPLTSQSPYPQPIGTLGSYEQNVAQGFGMMSNPSTRQFARGGSHQGTISSNRIQFATDKGGKCEKVRESDSLYNNAFDAPSDRNRGPRASRQKSNGYPKVGSSSGTNDGEYTFGINTNRFNSPKFVTDYNNAKFFVIKSFGEDNIHKSIKYSVWASTPLGNRKLDAAYREAKEVEGGCPVFLFFSVNASGQFCGVAEMVGPVDFEHDADYWHQDRWSGQLPITWHMIKDVRNGCFAHILLENNDNKPVTHSRDSQEVKLEQGIEMLTIFKSYEAETSLLDDFSYYDDREKSLMERKAKNWSHMTTETDTSTLAAQSINQLSDNLADTLSVDYGKDLSKPDMV